jgi:hypothetical protein
VNALHPRPVDAGAIEIRRLLTTPNPKLARAGRYLAAALNRGISLRATPRLRLVVEPSLAKGITQVQTIYRDLRKRIAAIETERRAGKTLALEGLDQLDASFALLLRSTRANSLAAYERFQREATTHQARAAAELRQSLTELT